MSDLQPLLSRDRYTDSCPHSPAPMVRVGSEHAAAAERLILR